MAENPVELGDIRLDSGGVGSDNAAVSNRAYLSDDAASPGDSRAELASPQNNGNRNTTELLASNEREAVNTKQPAHNPNIAWKLLICLLTLLILILIVVIAVLASRITPECGKGTQIVMDQSEPSVFDSLSQSELEAARDYMLQNSGLPLVKIDQAKPNNAFMYLIDLQVPKKAQVLNYLDNNGPKPDRVAKVFIARGDLTPPILEEYLVNLDEKTHELYKNPSYSRDPIPYATRPLESVEVGYTSKLYQSGLAKVERILIESYGAKYNNCSKKDEPCLIAIDIAPRGRSSGERKSWVFLLRDVHGYYLHPVGFQFQVTHEGTDPSKWFISKYFYNGQIFDTAEALLTAYDTGTVEKVKNPFPTEDQNNLYSSLNQRGQPSGDARRPPTVVYPDGPRYSISGQKVTYMNWQFDFRMNPSTGIKLFDVRFKGQRLIYEVGNVDAIVFYSGNDPMQGIVNFYDASWLLGVFSFELAKGVDCPNTATYFNFPFLHNSNDVKMNRNSMCIFEHDNGLPLGRHYSADFVNGQGYRNYAGMGDYVLILRYIPVIWNYDYIIDYIFHQDGVLEIRVATSGYLQTTFHSVKEERYAYKVEQNVVGPIHHHVLNFKADVDIAGLENRFATLDIKMENVTYPWSKDPQYKVQKYFEKQDYNTEQEALIKYNFDTPKYYIVYNNNTKNKLGYHKGVRVKLSGMSKVLMPFDNSEHNPVNGAAQSQYQLAVTKQKDSEASSTSIYTQNDPYNPVVNFEKYIEDNENIQDQDLVLWATLGVHHIPSVEDVPITTTSSNRASVYLIPYNYHDETNPMVDSRDLVSVEPSEDLSQTKVQWNGVKQGLGCWQDFDPFSYNGTNFL